jgi:cbb3-type cytochrome oxidase subunit 3
MAVEVNRGFNPDLKGAISIYLRSVERQDNERVIFETIIWLHLLLFSYGMSIIWFVYGTRKHARFQINHAPFMALN